VDSAVAQRLPLKERTILSKEDASRSPEDAFKLMSARMKDVGRREGAKPSGGNSTKRIRMSLSRHLTKDDVERGLRAVPSKRNFRSEERLPADDLRSIQANHVWDSVQRLLTAPSPPHAFGESTDYDLLVNDDRRLSPKAVFGLAASKALGFEVLPKHFTAGIGTPCFEVLEAAGYKIVPKGEEPNEPEQVPEDLSWTEGSRRLVAHLRSERARGLPQAKKAAFRAEHGRLFCERCGLDPEEAYGMDHGAACIEVHHARMHVADMASSHASRLEDLQCLCANCHRVVHSELRAAGR
jgi:5-methylcytosine-specific restriction protein A